MIGHEIFEPGNFLPQDGTTLRGAAAVSGAGYRVARCPTVAGPTVDPVARPDRGTPGA